MIFSWPLPELATAIILASTGLCSDVSPPAIHVVAKREDAIIRRDMSKAQLQNMGTDTKMPHQMMNLAHIETGGLLHSDIHIGYEVGFETVPAYTAQKGALSCIRYDRIDITFTLNPVIYIANDYAADSCWYREIYEHEQSHVDMDANVIHKYAEFVQEGMKMAFATQQDFIAGPVIEKDIPDLKQKMGADVVAMVSVLTSGMALERLEKQQGVDSLGGYAYIMNSCYDGPNVVKVIPEKRR